MYIQYKDLKIIIERWKFNKIYKLRVRLRYQYI